jgi:hypothetical protein
MRIDKLATVLLLCATLNPTGAGYPRGAGHSTTTKPEFNCGSVGENNTYTFLFSFQFLDDDNNNSTTLPETIDAVITFDWEVYSYEFNETLDVGKMYEFQSTYAYEDSGYYMVGCEVAWDSDAFATGLSALLQIEEDSCNWGATTNAPTITPYPSETPTESPTTSSATTRIEKLPIATIFTFLLSMAMLCT